jgi:hypothetical protein
LCGIENKNAFIVKNNENNPCNLSRYAVYYNQTERETPIREKQSKRETAMKKINNNKVNITSSGYIYVDGRKINKIPITPLHVPGSDITGSEEISDYAREWAQRNYRMVQN